MESVKTFPMEPVGDHGKNDLFQGQTSLRPFQLNRLMILNSDIIFAKNLHKHP